MISNLTILLIAVMQLVPAYSQNPSEDDQRVILQNISIVDVGSGTVNKNMDIVLQGKRILDITPHRKGWKDKDVRLVDLTGKYAIPGLIEGHTHIGGSPERCLTFALKKGVTALRDMGGDGAYLKELQDAINAGELSAPDIYFSALMGGRHLIMNDARAKLSTPPSYDLGEAPWMRMVENTSNVEQIIAEAKNCGATGVKMYSHLTADLCKKLSAEAKKQNLKVWAHAVVYPATVEDVLDAGAEVISHVNGVLLNEDWKPQEVSSLAFDESALHSERLKRIFQTMKEKNIRFDPTLGIANWQVSPITDKKKADELRRLMFDAVKAAYDSGVKIIAGTDYPLPRTEGETLALHWEIEMLANDVGLSPIDALRAATINNAEILGIDNTHGTLEVGKAADIVVLEDNPLEDISNIERVFIVIKNGEIVN